MKSKIIVALLIMNMVISASAQNQNQYGLVYRDAISENVVGKVTIHPVSYEVGGIGVVANIYTPANYDSSKEYVAIVIAHPNGGVKEQVAGLYAQRLAELPEHHQLWLVLPRSANGDHHRSRQQR